MPVSTSNDYFCNRVSSSATSTAKVYSCPILTGSTPSYTTFATITTIRASVITNIATTNASIIVIDYLYSNSGV